MTEPIQNIIKETYTNSQNYLSSDISKQQISLSNINPSINPNFNSIVQENIFNELVNSTNYQESKGNSSFYNFSESIQSNQDNINTNSNNSNIVMNKEQLYQTFLLFQKFLFQNMNNSCINSNNNTISPNKNGIKISTKNNNKNNDVIDEIKEIDNINESVNEEIYNGKELSEKNISQNHNIQNQLQKNENMNINNHKELIQSKSHYNIINGGNDNIIFLEESENMNKNKNNNDDILYKNDMDNENNIPKLNDINININKNEQHRNNKNIYNKVAKNSYDDIPIKFNKENFIDLVEKKLADEKKYDHFNQKNDNIKFEILNKIKPKKQSENFIKKSKIKLRKKNNDAKEIIIRDKNEEIKYEDKEKNEKLKLKISDRKNNNISKNYSYDREDTHTHILNENKNVNNFENSNIIDNLNNFINNIDKNKIHNTTFNDNDKKNIVSSKENLNK